MNDTELDEILNAWQVPAAPAAMRERVRTGFAERTSESRWKRVVVIAQRNLLAGAVVALAASLLVVTRAFPQRLDLVSAQDSHPYNVISELVRYEADGSRTIEMYSASYNNERGQEVVISRILPDNPVGTAIARTLDAARPLVNPLLLRLAGVTDAQKAAMKSFPGIVSECGGKNCVVVGRRSLPQAAANPGIGCVDGAVAGRETILGYATAAVQMQQGDRRRMTAWLAPALGCFALRVESEEQQADGIFHPVSGKHALSVRLNPSVK